MEEVQLALGARYRTVRLEINAAFIVLDVEEVDLLHAVVYPVMRGLDWQESTGGK
jgi:hypothetical protein